MTYPVLFSPGETDFESNGLGALSDATVCRVTMELSGLYELELQYPVTGLHFGDLQDRSIIKARIPQVGNSQLFRVYAQSRPMSGLVTVHAAHISYDMAGIPVKPFRAVNMTDAVQQLQTNAVTPSPFILSTDRTAAKPYAVRTPQSLMACLRGQQGSLVDTYGGELELDNYQIRLRSRLGQDRGVSVRYGKNLLDITQDQNCAEIVSGVYPYWVDFTTDEVTQLPDPIVKAPVELPFERIKPLDLSTEFAEQPTADQLRARAEAYLENNESWKPRVNLTVSYVQLEQTEEYRGTALLERVYLGDTVHVEFPALGVSTTARATRIVTDVLTGTILSVHLGSSRRLITDTISQQQQEIDNIGHVPSYAELQKAVDNATGWITNGQGYMVAVQDAAGNWREICSLDTPDIDSAVNVWRWNNGGFGFSSSGYNGPYRTAITQDGKIVADFITTGTLDAALVKVKNLIADRLKSVRGRTTMEISGGRLQLSNGTNVCVNLDMVDAGLPILYMDNNDAEFTEHAELAPGILKLGGTSLNPLFTLSAYNSKGHSTMQVGSINPGKTVLLTDAAVDVGSSVTVPNSQLYDLFAVRLREPQGPVQTVVLAYRVNDQIRGIGGYCGTSSEYKQIYFLTAQESGDQWTLIDSGAHDVYKSGGISAGRRLQLAEIIGVI